MTDDTALKAAFNDLLANDLLPEARHWPKDQVDKFRRKVFDLSPSAAMQRPSKAGKRSGKERTAIRAAIVDALAAAWVELTDRAWFPKLGELEKIARLPDGCCRKRQITRKEIEAAARAF